MIYSSEVNPTYTRIGTLTHNFPYGFGQGTREASQTNAKSRGRSGWVGVQTNPTSQFVLVQRLVTIRQSTGEQRFQTTRKLTARVCDTFSIPERRHSTYKYIYILSYSVSPVFDFELDICVIGVLFR